MDGRSLPQETLGMLFRPTLQMELAGCGLFYFRRLVCRGRTVTYFLLRTSSTTCRTAVTMESGDSSIPWPASTTTCCPRVDKRTRLACS